MHGFRVVRALEVGVDFLRDKRSERRGDLRELDEHIAKRPVRAKLVAVVRGLPEAATRAANVPVGQVFDKLDERPHRALQIVGVHRRGNVGDKSLHRRDDPLVENVPRIGEADLCVREIVYIRVSHEEGVRVPPRNQEVAHELLDAVLGELEVLGANDRRVDHVESNRVRPVGVEHLRGVWVVLEALRHLLAVFRKNKAVDDDVLVRRLVEETGAENHERVEPAARLVKTFGDEVGGEELRDFIVHGQGCGDAGLQSAISHVMLLSIRHRP